MKLFWLTLLLPMALTAQPDHADVSHIAEDLVAVQDEDVNYEEIYENLMQYAAHPVDINRATPDDLRMLFILSERQVQSLIRYREEAGPLLSIYELQAVPGFDPPTLEKLSPFVRVADPSTTLNRSLVQRMLSGENSYLIARYERTMEKRKGEGGTDPESRYAGSPDKWYLRLRSSVPGSYSAGLTLEKDVGEPFAWNASARYYFADFHSVHLQLKNKRRIKNLIIGDYQAQFGQGLIFGSAFGLGKGGETITTIKKPSTGYLPYSSSNESGFYRGAATTVEISRSLNLSVHYSGVWRDASIRESDSAHKSISAFQQTGLHRTPTEIQGKKQVHENSYGAVLELRRRDFETGILFQSVSFSAPLAPRASLFNQFAFQGSGSLATGMYLNYSRHNVTLFFEGAHALGKGIALVGGALISLHTNFDAAILLRRYDRDYQGIYANAFAESTQPQNEQGLYWGWKYRFSRKHSLSGYIDLFRFPWLGFRRYAPAEGYEWLVRLTYQPTRKITSFVQWREESKPRNTAAEGVSYLVQEGIKRNAWFAVSLEAMREIKLKMRLQYSQFEFDGTLTEGLVLAQDVSFSFWKIALTGRYALFQTDNFDNRQYSYENDAFMAFSLPAYDGVGIRSFAMLQVKVSKSISLWARYSRSRFKDRSEVGSGLDQIAGNTRNDLKLQALFRF